MVKNTESRTLYISMLQVYSVLQGKVCSPLNLVMKNQFLQSEVKSNSFSPLLRKEEILFEAFKLPFSNVNYSSQKITDDSHHRPRQCLLQTKKIIQGPNKTLNGLLEKKVNIYSCFGKGCPTET